MYVCTEQPLEKSSILPWAGSPCRMPACAAGTGRTVSAQMQPDFRFKSSWKHKDVLFGFEGLIFTEFLELVTLSGLTDSLFPPEEWPPSGAGDWWWSLLRGQRKASLQHSHQTQAEAKVTRLCFCPSDWERTDLRCFVPNRLFGGWKSSTRLLHWRWRENSRGTQRLAYRWWAPGWGSRKPSRAKSAEQSVPARSKQQQTKNMSSKNLPSFDCDTHPNWSVEVFSGEAHDYESQPRHTIKPPLGKTEVVDERADVGGNNVANT